MKLTGTSQIRTTKNRTNVRRRAAPGYLGKTFSSLQDRNYRYFWFGLVALMAAVNIQMVARAQLAWDLTNSIVMVGIVSAAFAPPILLFSLFGGVVADRLDRKRVIQGGQFGISIISLFIAVSILTNTVSVWHLVASAVVQGGMWAFLMPARQAIIPQIVGPEKMTNAIALNASGMSLMTLAAPGIGGLLYAWAGVESAYFTIAGLAMLSAILTGLIPRLRSNAPTRRRPMAYELVDGLQFVRANRTVMLLLILALATTVFAMPFRSLLPAFVEDSFQRDAAAVGLLLSMIGCGSLVGSLFIAGLQKNSRRGIVLLATTAISGVAIALAAFTPSYAVAAVVMVLLGIGDSGRRSLNASLIMENTDEEHRGRVMGIYMMNFGLIPLGVIPLAAVAEEIGLDLAFAGSGGILVVAAIMFMLLTSRVRRL